MRAILRAFTVERSAHHLVRQGVVRKSVVGVAHAAGTLLSKGLTTGWLLGRRGRCHSGLQRGHLEFSTLRERLHHRGQCGGGVSDARLVFADGRAAISKLCFSYRIFRRAVLSRLCSRGGALLARLSQRGARLLQARIRGRLFPAEHAQRRRSHHATVLTQLLRGELRAYLLRGVLTNRLVDLSDLGVRQATHLAVSAKAEIRSRARLGLGCAVVVVATTGDGERTQSGSSQH